MKNIRGVLIALSLRIYQPYRHKSLRIQQVLLNELTELARKTYLEQVDVKLRDAC
jgi:hypothetical protein